MLLPRGGELLMITLEYTTKIITSLIWGGGVTAYYIYKKYK